MSGLWSQAFLAERPSLSLSLFRFAVAFTVGAHMIPALLVLPDQFLDGAFRTQNGSFFPAVILQWVNGHPDGVIYAVTGLFALSLAAFTLGLWTQASCILMTLTCYYFYARNNFFIGTLSFDILLVTLVLMCVTPYPGDFLSFDSLRRGTPHSERRRRPFFLQRLLQIQLAVTFWHTALNKVSAGGNWLTDRPFYYLMHYPPEGVVRNFPLRGWLAGQPEICYALGIALIVFEFLMPVAWFLPVPRVRGAAIALGIAFQLMLWITLHVPTIFLFLFPPMMLLFLPPESIVRWIEARQARHAARGRALLLYDGHCGLCRASVKQVLILDVFGWVDPLDIHTPADLHSIHPALTLTRCKSEIVLVELNGRLSGGFDAFRRLSRHLPMLWPVWPFLRLPGAGWVGRRVYRWVSLRRYVLHRGPRCKDNQCGLDEPASGNGNGSPAAPGEPS